MQQSMTIQRFLKRIAIATFVLFMLFYILVATQFGLSMVWNLAQRFAPGQLTAQTVQGSLISHMSFTNLNYIDNETKVTVKSFDFGWRAYKVLFGEFNIKEIKLSGVEVYLPEATVADEAGDANNANGSSSGNGLKFLANINIERAAISDIAIYQNNKPVYQIYDLLVTRNQDGSHHLSLLASFGKLTGTYHLSYFPVVKWQADLVAEKINLAKLSPAIDGVINFHVKTHGEWGVFAQKVFIDLADLSGRFQGNDLKAITTFDYDNGEFSVQNANIKLGDATAVVTGKLHDAWDISWNVNIPNLRNLAKDYRGSFTSVGSVKGSRQQPELSLSVDGKRIKFNDISVQQLQGKIATQFKSDIRDSGNIVLHNLAVGDIRIPRLELKSSSWFDGKQLKNKATILLDAKNTIETDISLPKFTSFTDFKQPIKGNIKVNLTDLSHLTSAIRKAQKLKSLRGRLTGVIDLSGKLSKPKIKAELALLDGGMYAEKIGLDLSGANVQVKYHTGSPVTLDGSVYAGQGKLNIDGKFNVDSPALSMSLNVHGNDLQVMDSKEYKVRVSPDINLSYRNNDLFIKGTVSIPYALIEPTDFSSTQTLSSDVEIVNKKSDSAIPTNLAFDVMVKLGDDVHVKYQDIKTQLLGNLQLMQRPGNPPTGVGELSIKAGTYKAYGRSLQIDQGRFVYTGNLLTNPGISLRASTKVKSGQLTVGVNVNGTLDKPLLSLYSNPAGLSQGDILSYLLFGTAQSDSAATSGLALLNVAAGMAGGGGGGNPLDGITGKLGLKVDTGTTQYIDTSEGGNGEVKTAQTVGVGKDIGRNITIHYGMSLFQQAMTFSLRYQLSRRFAIQTETSTLESGGDILYSMESEH